MCEQTDATRQVRQAACRLSASCIRGLLGVDTTPLIPNPREFDELLAKLDKFEVRPR